MVFHGAPLRRRPYSPTPVPLISPHSDAHSDGEPSGAPPAGEDRAELVLRLFREHNQALIGFLLGRVNSQQEAQEIAQEAYVRMLELDTAGAIGFLRAYLFKLAANLAVDRARQRATHTRLQETWVDPFEYISQEPSAERGAAARQELQLVRRFMAELPPRCRVAFYLHPLPRSLRARHCASRRRHRTHGAHLHPARPGALPTAARRRARTVRLP